MNIHRKMGVSIAGRDEQIPYASGSAGRGAGVDAVLQGICCSVTMSFDTRETINFCTLSRVGETSDVSRPSGPALLFLEGRL